MAGYKNFKRDYDVVCPYYKKESGIDIKCEGCCGSSVTTTVNFLTKQEKQDYKYDFCKGLYQSCALFQLLDDLNG